MPKITLTDNSSLTADATILDDAALGKSPASVLHFLRSDVIAALDQTLDAVQIDMLALGFNFLPAVSFKGGTATFTAGGGLTGSFDLHKPAKLSTTPSAKPDDNSLFPKDQYGSSIDMQRNYYVALGFQLSLQAKLADARAAYTLTPSATSASSGKLYLPFAPDAKGAYPNVKSALAALCEAYKLPSTPAEMLAFPAGAVFVYDAQGKVCFTASIDLLTEVNPTASLGNSTYGPITVTAGPGITLGGGFTLTGQFQVRLWNKDGKTIQLGYYKKQGATFSVTFDASVSADATIGGFDLVAKVYELLGSQGKLDPAWVKANVPASVAEDVQAAYKAAVQTKLSIAIDEECDTTLTDQVAFSWSFDTEAMDADAQSAFETAIHGDLSRLMSGSALPLGVSKVGSVFDHLKSTKHTFSFNFLGLFDYASVEQALLEMTVKVSDDGQVVIADKATLTRLSATATPFVKSDLLRKVLAEDFVATMGYSTSLGHLSTSLDVHYTYYDYLRRARSADLAHFVSIAATLADAGDPKQDWAALQHSGISSQSASLLASLGYDNASALRLFYGDGAAPRSIADYVTVARQALALTPGLSLNETFVTFLKDDAKWQQLVDTGARGNFFALLGADQAYPPVWAQAAYAWKQHILLWAPAMHSAAQALEEVRSYAASKPDLQPLTDAEFIQKRKSLASQLSAAVQAAPLFHDALGIITIQLAARPSNTSVNISYAGKSALYS
jgi:hypothetical protein